MTNCQPVTTFSTFQADQIEFHSLDERSPLTLAIQETCLGLALLIRKEGWRISRLLEPPSRTASA